MIDYADESHRWAADRFEILGILSECLRAKIVSVSHSHFNSQGCQTLLLKESEP